MSAPLVVEAVVAGHERAMIAAAAEQLSAAVARAQGAAWPIRLRFADPDAAPDPDALAIVSLGVDLAQGWTTERRAAFWSRRDGRTYLCTLYRHVPDRRRRPALVERIRALDLFAIRLSRERDVMLVDLDRAFALVGAAALAGAIDRIGGREIAETVLRDGLVERLPPGVQQRALIALMKGER